ncbi:MAG: type I-C CRISPR-associated protein Cas5c [Thermoanaerobaculia bacterium]
MSERSPTFKVRARGPYACFTRPELKAERVSYEVMTPSAARGLLEAVLWKPAIRWSVERIHVLAPIRFEGVRRNEVSSKASIGGALGQYFADEDRQQRNTVLLKDVDYVIEAHFEMTGSAGAEDNVRKFVEMFERRLARGQCFHTPYLGCREFVARVEPAPERWDVPETLREKRDLGLMLHDLRFGADGSSKPVFFRAVMARGRVNIPEVLP